MRRLRALGGVVTDMLAMRLAARRALALAEMTGNEVDHRAMNSLQFVASLLQLSEPRRRPARDGAGSCARRANRVLAVARCTAPSPLSARPIACRSSPISAPLCEELSSSVGSEIRLESQG